MFHVQIARLQKMVEFTYSRPMKKTDTNSVSNLLDAFDHFLCFIVFNVTLFDLTALKHVESACLHVGFAFFECLY